MMNEGTRVKEFTREEIRDIAGETLKAIGVETGEMDEGEREIVEGLAKAWLNRKRNEGK